MHKYTELANEILFSEVHLAPHYLEERSSNPQNEPPTTMKLILWLHVLNDEAEEGEACTYRF